MILLYICMILGVFHCKGDPNENIIKWKALWVLRGDLQDIDFDTYAVVVDGQSRH